MKNAAKPKLLLGADLFEDPQRPRLKGQPGWFEYAAVAIILAICLSCYCYTDLPLIARHSMTLWDALGQGKLFHFYRMATQAPVGATLSQTGEVPYDIWVYLMLAVWNLPVYLWEHLTGATLETSLAALLWVRLVILLPFAGCCRAIYGIGGTLGRPHGQCLWAMAVFAGSLYLLNGSFCLSQIDLFSLFFSLMGLWAYLRGDGRKFILWFMPAITCKVFGLMVFLPLLLLREKRLLRLAGDTLTACALTLLSKILFFADKSSTPTGFDERRFVRMLWENRLDLGGTSVSVFVLMFGALALTCWCARVTPQNRAAWAVWAMAGGYICFFAGGAGYPYWAVLMAPLASLFMLLYPGRADTILLLDLAAGASYFLRSLYSYPGLYDGWGNQRWMLAGRICGRQSSELFTKLAAMAGGEHAAVSDGILTAVFWVCCAGLLVLCWPMRRNSEEEGEEASVHRGLFWLRLCVNGALVLAPLAMYCIR